MANTVGIDQPFRYRGYVYDAETGWYYLESRYYDPTVCRFINADVLLSTGQGIIGHNAFAYCLNNPTARKDQGGHYSEALAIMYENSTDNGGGGGCSGNGSGLYRTGKVTNAVRELRKAIKTVLGDHTIQQGIGGSAAFGPQASFSLSCGIDTSGNLGCILSVGLGAGSPSAGLYIMNTISNASSLNGLEGVSASFGGSANVYQAATAGMEFGGGKNAITGEPVFAISVCAGISAKSPIPAEVHATASSTIVLFSFNVFDWIEELLGGY